MDLLMAYGAGGRQFDEAFDAAVSGDEFFSRCWPS